MAFLRFTRLPKHRNFNYVPRYYDKKKEELDKIVNRVKKEGDANDTEALRDRISSRMKSGYTGKVAARKQIMNSNIRLVLIIIFLCILSFFVLNMNLEKLLELLS